MENIGTSSVQDTSKGNFKWYPFGFDFGNSEVSVVVLKPNIPKERMDVFSLSVPTAFTQLNTGLLRSMGVDTSKATIIKMKDEQTSYGVGSIALSQSSDTWNGRGDIRRYASPYSLRGLLAMSGTLIPDQEYGIMVVTGLPAQTFQANLNLRKEIKETLSGKWTFTLDGRTWRTCHVEVGRTMMEGAGALVAYGTSNESSQGSGIIDIGGRTTDLYVAQKHTPVIDFCKGKPVGVESASNMMMAAFEEKYGFALSQQEVRTIMHTYAELQSVDTVASPPAKRVKRGKTAETSDPIEPITKPRYPDISVTGRLVPQEDIHQFAHEAVLQITTEIVSFVAASWHHSDKSDAVGSRFNPVIGIGGGIYYFGHALKKRIPHLTWPNDPVHANALGYARAAEHLLEQKLKKARG